MSYNDFILKLKPHHFAASESFDAETFAMLKEALPKRRRNRIILTVAGVIMVIVSLIFVFTIGGIPVVPCMLVYLLLALLLKTTKWNKQIKEARQALGITQKDIKTACGRVKVEMQQELAEGVASFLPMADSGKKVLVDLVGAIEEYRRDFWKMSVFWIFMLFIGFGLFGIFFTSMLKMEFAAGDGVKEKIALLACILMTLLLSYWQERKMFGHITTACTKLGITFDDVNTAMRQAKHSMQPTSLAKRKGMPGCLIWAIVIYVLIVIPLAPLWADISEDYAGFIPIILSITGIVGTVLVYRIRTIGHLLVLLPIALSLVAGFILELNNDHDLIAFAMSATFFIIPYLFVRFFALRNNIDHVSVKTRDRVVYGCCALLLVMAVILLSGKSYQRIDDFRNGAAKVQSKDDKWGFIGFDRKEITPCIYDDVRNFILPGTNKGYWYDNEDKLQAIVCLNGKWGIIDRQGKEIIAYKYDDINNIQKGSGALNGLWKVQSEGKWGVIDSIGNMIIPNTFEEINHGGKNIIEAIMNGKKMYFDRQGMELDSAGD